MNKILLLFFWVFLWLRFVSAGSFCFTRLHCKKNITSGILKNATVLPGLKKDNRKQQRNTKESETPVLLKKIIVIK